MVFIMNSTKDTPDYSLHVLINIATVHGKYFKDRVAALQPIVNAFPFKPLSVYST